MILKTANGSIDIGNTIEVEESIKLFDGASFINGSFSYSFQVGNTSEIRTTLGFYGFNDLSKPWNYRIDASILSDSGEEIHVGFLRIEEIVESAISMSFYAGNSDWFDILNINIRDVRIRPLDEYITPTTISNSWSADSGIVWPLVDRGGLSTRRCNFIYDEDFHPFIRVHEGINFLLSNYGIKLEGSILNDYVYKNMITSNSSQSSNAARIETQKTRIGMTSNQVVTDETSTVIEFDDDSTPYYNSPSGNWDTSTYRYTFTEHSMSFFISFKVSVTVPFLSYAGVRTYYNGTLLDERRVYANVASTIQIIASFSDRETNISRLIGGAAIGGYLEFQLYYVHALGTTSATILTGSEITVYPTKFNLIHAETLLPDTDIATFCSDVFRMLNGFCYYNPNTKVITVDTMDTVLSRDPVDISEYVEIDSINFVDFISNYAKRNLLTYESQEAANEIIYNNSAQIPYGSGLIEVDNDFLEYEKNILESEFFSTWHDNYEFFGNLPKLDYVELKEGESVNFTGVTDNGGYARFAVPSVPTGNVLVRVSESTVEEYNGDYDRLTNGGTYIELSDVFYQGDATGKITVLIIQDKDNDDQTILINLPDVPVSDFSTVSEYEGSNLGSNIDTIGLAYFEIPDNGTELGKKRLNCLSFDTKTDSNNVGMKRAYFNKFENILNNGQLIRCRAFLPKKVYDQLDFLRPVRISTKEMTAQFLLSIKRGYKGAHLPCELELIKF